MGLIDKSVGKKGHNNPQDVKVVQRLLNKHSLPPLRDLTVDGDAGPNTIRTIEHFQEVVVKMRIPDGRVDPGGKTIRHLNRGPQPDTPTAVSTGDSASQTTTNSSQLSGETWWRANQGKYQNRRGLEYLTGSFRENATRFVSALRKAGATISIGSTLRHKTRAHLMHYSWQLSKGNVRAKDVPSLQGLSIEWDHGDESVSRKAAGKMKQLFNMAYYASLTSNHIRGHAVDMTITWKGNLTVKIPGRHEAEVIRTGPRNGSGNRQLHQLGREFGVKKLVKDAPHWSHNGR